MMPLEGQNPTWACFINLVMKNARQIFFSYSDEPEVSCTLMPNIDVESFKDNFLEMDQVIIVTPQKKSKRLRRIPCLSHSLQLVMVTFDKYRMEHLHNPGRITSFFIKVIARTKKICCEMKLT
jgi:hypothetical protein